MCLICTSAYIFGYPLASCCIPELRRVRIWRCVFLASDCRRILSTASMSCCILSPVYRPSPPAPRGNLRGSEFETVLRRKQRRSGSTARIHRLNPAENAITIHTNNSKTLINWRQSCTSSPSLKRIGRKNPADCRYSIAQVKYE